MGTRKDVTLPPLQLKAHKTSTCRADLIVQGKYSRQDLKQQMRTSANPLRLLSDVKIVALPPLFLFVSLDHARSTSVYTCNMAHRLFISTHKILRHVRGTDIGVHSFLYTFQDTAGCSKACHTKRHRLRQEILFAESSTASTPKLLIENTIS